ncbi:MAG: PilN domain-containing protein [Thermodesulfovibrionales bacterium]
MIRVNLLPVKKRKKQKPLPTFMISMVFVTLIAGAILAYLVFFFSGRLAERQATVRNNETKIAELKQKIKDVEDFEKRNADFQKRKEIIEQLGKNKTLPVKILDEINKLLPPGVWLVSMDVAGDNVNLSCTAFTNTDVVNYVDNLKLSKLFADIYLQESVQAQASGYPIYNFRLTFKVKA